MYILLFFSFISITFSLSESNNPNDQVQLVDFEKTQEAKDWNMSETHCRHFNINVIFF